jgi:hypothetical protein
MRQVVVPKGDDQGKYVHPELYGKPLSKSVVVLPGMTPGTQPKFEAQNKPQVLRCAAALLPLPLDCV